MKEAIMIRCPKHPEKVFFTHKEGTECKDLVVKCEKCGLFYAVSVWRDDSGIKIGFNEVGPVKESA